jgi:hypothetical protein
MFLMQKYVDKMYEHSRTCLYNLSPVLIEPSVSDFIRINMEFGSTSKLKGVQKNSSTVVSFLWLV